MARGCEGEPVVAAAESEARSVLADAGWDAKSVDEHYPVERERYAGNAESLAWSQSAPRRELWGHVIAPTLVLTGDETLDLMTTAAKSIESTLPNAEHRTIPAANHSWEPHIMATTIADFLHERAGI